MCIPSYEGVVVKRVMSRNWRVCTEENNEVHQSVCPMTLQGFIPGGYQVQVIPSPRHRGLGRNIQGVLEQGGSEEIV